MDENHNEINIEEIEEDGDIGMVGINEQAAIDNIVAERSIPEYDEMKSLMDKSLSSTVSAQKNKKLLFSQLQDFFFGMCGKILEQIKKYLITETHFLLVRCQIIFGTSREDEGNYSSILLHGIFRTTD